MTPRSRRPQPGNNAKLEALEPYRVRRTDGAMTTDQGIPIPHTDDSLKAGPRGSGLLEDFHLREKITRFDHERIPERVVHARGTAAHGTFRVYEPLARYTKAAFLNDPSIETPVFARFSTVVGSRGSSDTVRDTRGFSVKFYTSEGNFDLVANNIPVFFIQDGIKFPDVVHALKPEPHNEIPQAQSAHDTFWDFMSLVPETTHHTLWNMSDRGIPRSYRMMEGFGVNTFRLVAADGATRLVKFHWKPLLGVHGLAWDEAQELSGRDPDYHRRDLWEAIERGAFPEWEFGLQVVDEDQVMAFGFDLLDATKLLPEELVPVERVGRLRLDRNVDDFFAETEQVAFHLGNLVPGIDVSEDPLLQARLFSYLDTQLTRLGGPNFAEIPVNRPITRVTNHQQDGFHKEDIEVRRANYHPNSIEGGHPELASSESGYVHAPIRLGGPKTRERSESFADHFSQPAMFVASLTDPERDHLTEALRVEVGRVSRAAIRDRVVNEILVRVDPVLAGDVASAVGVELRDPPAPRPPGSGRIPESPALRMVTDTVWPVDGRRVAVLVADGVRGADIRALATALEERNAVIDVVAETLTPVIADDGSVIAPAWTFLTASSVLFDAVFVPAGAAAAASFVAGEEFLRKAWRHCKPLAFTGDTAEAFMPRHAAGRLDRPGVGVADPEMGVLVGPGVDDPFMSAFLQMLGRHRFWWRQTAAPLIAQAAAAPRARRAPTRRPGA